MLPWQALAITGTGGSHSHTGTDDMQDADELLINDFPFLHDESPERAAAYCRLALERIGEQRTSAIPLNYALFYFYAAGSNTLFNAKMDRLLADESDWRHDTAVQLFMRYFTPCSDASMADLQREMLAVINGVIESVVGAAGTSQQRADRIAQQVDRLRGCTDARQAVEMAAGIALEAQQLVAESRRLVADLRGSADEVGRLREELLHARREASTDALTGLRNRRAFDRDLARLIQRHDAEGLAFSLIMMDIDHFKAVNDRHGHLVGDRVLRQFARQVAARTRGGDTVARYGGEEFAILLPCTQLLQAGQIAEHVREGIGALNMRRTDTGAPIGTVTASFGVAEFRAGEGATTFVARADAALYRAKREGRNRVVIAD